jgi:N-methylhydantoinase B
MGDLGGTDIYPTHSRSVYDEGLLLPPMKLVSRGRLNEDLAAVIQANSRLPRETLGNMVAAGAALRMGSRKFADVVRRFGFDVFRAAVDQLLTQGEQEVRGVIAALPDGTYTVTDHLDDDAINDDPVPLVCSVTVDGSDLTVDTTGSAAQVEGPLNSTLPMTIAACRLALKRLTTQDRLPSNSGEHRALHVIAPAGSVFNAEPPAATFQMALTAQRLGELIHSALAQAADDRFPAASAGDATFVSGLMTSESGRPSFFDGMAPIGYGATASADGMNALFHFPLAGLKVASAEVTEVRTPVMLAVAELSRDSGGPGTFRGGLGTRYEWRVLAEGIVNLFAEKQTTPAIQGRAGGHPAGQRNATVVRPGLPAEVRGGKRAQVRLFAGDVVVIEGGSGAGHGDPLLRAPEAVAEDVRQGYVSHEAARSVYGVVLDPETLEVDVTATTRARTADSGRALGAAQQRSVGGEHDPMEQERP